MTPQPPAGRPPSPRRVAVTSPRARAARRETRWGVAREIDAQSPVGEVYVRALVRHQLRLAVIVLVALAGGLVSVPLLLLGIPALADAVTAGLPLPWWVLGVGAYPALLALGWWHVRAAERAERDFADLVERS